jgi:MFS family permease
VFLKPMAETFSWSRETAGVGYGLMALVAAAAAPVLGVTLDRVGARRIIPPCLLVSGIGLMSLAALTDRLWHFYAAFSLIGIATIGTSPVAYSRVVFTWFDRERGRALALMLAGAGLSGMVTPPIAQWLIRTAGWRFAWLALGSFTVVVGVPLVFRFVRERPLDDARRIASSSPSMLGEALRSRAFWTLVAVTFASTLAVNGIGVHIIAMFTDRGVLPGQAAMIASALAAGNLAGRLLTGWLLDRLPAARVGCVLLATLAGAMLLLANTQTFGRGLIAAALMGLGAGGEFDVAPYLIGRYFGLRSISTLYGLVWTAIATAGALGPMWLGRAYDRTGSYAWLVVTLSAITLAAALLLLTLPTPVRASNQGAL